MSDAAAHDTVEAAPHDDAHDDAGAGPAGVTMDDAAIADEAPMAAAEVPPAPTAETRSRSPSRRFRHVDARLVLTPDQRRRQASIMRLAMDTLGTPDAIRSFLNDHHEGLGGRPLDVALSSDAGLAAAEALIGTSSGTGGRRG